MRASHVRGVQRAARSVAVASAAPRKLPSGLGERGQIWPLSRWVWMSTKPGQTRPPSRSTAPAGAVPSGAIAGDAAVFDLDVEAHQALEVRLAERAVPTRQARERASASQ